MANLACPVLFIHGAVDQMTPPKSAQTLLAQAEASGHRVHVCTVPVGHHQMNEAPEQTLQAMRDFLR